MFSKIYVLCISVYFCLYLRILSKLILELSKNLRCVPWSGSACEDRRIFIKIQSNIMSAEHSKHNLQIKWS